MTSFLYGLSCMGLQCAEGHTRVMVNPESKNTIELDCGGSFWQSPIVHGAYS